MLSKTIRCGQIYTGMDETVRVEALYMQQGLRPTVVLVNSKGKRRETDLLGFELEVERKKRKQIQEEVEW